jgi:hypothetical protein
MASLGGKQKRGAGDLIHLFPAAMPPSIIHRAFSEPLLEGPGTAIFTLSHLSAGSIMDKADPPWLLARM